ncbi:MAG: PQQ-binding-like beta-propeller repeat protein [Planctomycetota bacterium]
MLRNLALWTLLTTVWFASSASAENWPQFRGPSARGVSSQKGLPTEWGPDKNILWKIEVPGTAWSSPVIWENRVFLTTAVPEGQQEEPKKGLYFGGNREEVPDMVYHWRVLCFDLETGKKLWDVLAHEGKPATAIHLKNTYASETPVTDGERVYAFFGSAGLYCYDFAGKLLWKRDLGAYPTRFGWGTASSPVVDDGKVFIQDDNEEKSFLVALDAKNGEEIWRDDRKEISSWATPFVWHNGKRTELVTASTNYVRSYDPATGELLWKLSGMSSIAVPTPLAGDGLLYVSSGYVMDPRRPLFAIRPGATGDLTLKAEETSNSGIAWSQKHGGPYMPTPILVGQNIYVLYDRGFMACYDAATGEPRYEKQRVGRGGSGFTASPWSYDGKIFCLNEDGDTYVIEAGNEYKEVGKNSIDEMFMATPAIGKNTVLLRGAKHLYALRNLESSGK